MLKILSMEFKDFAEFVRVKRQEQDISLAELEKRAGNKITGAYVNMIENRQIFVENVSFGKMKGLARGLQISIEEVFFAAIGKDFAVSAPFQMQISSILTGAENWEKEKKVEFLRFLQIFVSGMDGTPKINGIIVSDFAELSSEEIQNEYFPKKAEVINIDGEEKIKKKKAG